MELGLGVLINMLFGNNDSSEIVKSNIGKMIKNLLLEDNKLKFTFNDDSQMALFDDGQSCCETRYMNTDDDLRYYIGSQFLNAEIRAGEEKNEEFEVKESQFLIVTTSLGSFTCVNYNEHNGYYGGFYIKAEKF